MYSWAITFRNYLDNFCGFFDENAEQYFKYEKVLVDAVISCLRKFNLTELYIHDLYHYALMSDDILNNGNDECLELKRYYAARFQNCIEKYPDKYNYSMRKLFFSISEGMNLNLTQVVDVLKLKFRNNICFFRLQADSKLCIDFGGDCLLIKSIYDCKKNIEEMGGGDLSISSISEEDSIWL